MSKKPYNGHESYAAWNVALWIANDESLYDLVTRIVKTSRNKDWAVAKLLVALPPRTPDGVRYSARTLKLAIRDWR